MGNPHVHDAILEAVGRRYKKNGDAFRMRHETTFDGTVCTPQTKDPAMVVTRLKDGWVYNCHRCHLTGFVGDTALSPRQTKQKIDGNRKAKEDFLAGRGDPTAKVTMPFDAKLMTGHDPAETGIPYEAYHWLWKSMVTEDSIQRWGVCWSEGYNRVIIPVYKYAEFGDGLCKKLVGWVGREVMHNSKEAREKAGAAKYLTKKQAGENRVYFMCPGMDKEMNDIIVVEDCLSAIRVNDATGQTTLALLTTSIDDNLMRWFRGHNIYLWLDADALAKSIGYVQRMRALGISAHHMHTPKDPKAYNSVFLSDFWNNVVKTKLSKNNDLTRGGEVLS